ncbi:MAG: response regulator [Subdoligranulum sp.]|nr:response regulator [Subdoligranulum sp.]
MKRKQKRHPHGLRFSKQALALLVCFVLLLSAVPAVTAAAPTAAAEEPAAAAQPAANADDPPEQAPTVSTVAPTNNRTVKAGVFFFEGYHMRDEDGNYSGYGIELLNLISQYSHLNFEFVGYENTWAEMQEMLLNGEIDVVTSARKTRARTELYGFSDPIERNSTVLSIAEDNTSIIPGEYSTYEGMMVGLLAGSSQNRTLAPFAEEIGFTYETREYEDSAQLEAALQRGEIDAILTSNLRRAEHEKVLDTTHIDYFYAITRKEDQEILDEINYAISQMNLHEGDYWANTLYNKYYGTSEISTGTAGLTQREQDYVDAVLSGEKQLTVTALPDRRPYSYAEDGEMKGILPQYFDRLMEIAGLPYEMIVPGDNLEYEQLIESGSVDVVIDWQQSSSTASTYAEGGFLTNTYMNTGTALVTRKNFHSTIFSLAILDGLVGLPLDFEQFEDTIIQTYSSPNDVMQAVLDGRADAAFMRTHTAQYSVNNDSTNSLQLHILDSDQIVFNMYIPTGGDHELVNILNKCIRQVPDDVLNRLIAEYTAGTPENVAFFEYMSAHPGTIFSMSSLVALALGGILFFYLRARWNIKLFRTTEQAKRELEEQLAITSALSRDLLTIYKLDLQAGTVKALKSDKYMPSGIDWESGNAFPYTEALHRFIEEWIFEEDRAELKEALALERLRKELSAGNEYTGNYRALLDGTVHNFQFVCVTYQTERQDAPRVLIGFRNIDDIIFREQKQKEALEEALHMAEAASEAKTAFLSNMSHDIRTPMNAIIGFLALMQDEADRPEMVREYIGRIDAASQHLLGLINDILDMSKIESGSSTLNLAEMNLAEIFAGINSIIQPQAKAKNQTFEISASHLKFEHLVGDKMRINQILINLLSNAVKYTPEHGAIELRVEELPQVVDNYSRIRFTVSDNGMGMSEDYLKVLFEPLTRENTKVSNQIQGTGLGMAITKRLVTLMGGSIEVQSKLGEGSTFVVELELRICEQENDPRFWADHRIARMIVVDDDEEICRGVVKTMAGVGVSAEYATTGEDAVRMVRTAQEKNTPYDLILLDWKMPEMSGLEAARQIRTGSQTPILLLTAFDWKEIEQEALEIGVNHFMPKPFFMSTFKEAVHQMTDHGKESRQQENDVVRGMHILAVDDIEVNQIILVKILTTLGAECETASNGREAVEKFMAADRKYDLIMMDIQMPEMNGYEATRAIRASGHPLANTTPIIAMTANAFVDDVRDAIESGMDAHIAKPVQIDTLKSTIRQVLDARAAAAENQ